MHPGLHKFLTDGEYRNTLLNDLDAWLIFIGLAYFFLLLINRDLFVKQKSFTWLLFTAIGLAILGNSVHFFTVGSTTAIMSLNGPLICLVVYRLAYEAYLKIFNKPPLSPLNITYNFQEGLGKDRVFNYLVLLTIAFSMSYLLTIK